MIDIIMTNSNNLVYICKEIFDENNCEPTKIEIEEQASRLGIDTVKELHLLSIAKKCLLEPLPSNWFPCFIEKENKYFYYNTQSKISQWEHPLDEYYRQIVEKTRSEDASTGQDVSLNIILDEDNSLDAMYHTNSNNEKKATEKRTVRFKTPIEESLDLDNSDDNMKFLGPIKLNTPNYTNSTSTLRNLPQFSTTNTSDFRNTASRSVLSKYNVLPSKDEQNRKSDLGENAIKVIDDSVISIDLNNGKENLRKIDITLTESSDRSESTSSEINTENLNSDYEGNDLKEKDNLVTTIEKNDNILITEDRRSESYSSNGFQSMGATKMYTVKKDDLVSDSGNFTEKDSKNIQSSMVNNSFSATKSKMAEITQRFPLNQYTKESKLENIKPKEKDVNIFDIKSKFGLMNSHDEKQLDEAHIKLIIENNCDLIKNKLEDTIKTKENIIREEIIKSVDKLIREQKDYFEKYIEERYDKQFNKSESELKNTIKHIMQEETGKSLIEECDRKYSQNISNAEQICSDNLSRFQKNVESYADMFKNKIQLELDTIKNELKKEFGNNSEIITDSWNKTLDSYKNIELEKVKNNFEQTTKNIKHDMDAEIHQYNLEFKEKLNIITEDKLSNITEKLDEAIREEINVVKNRVNEDYQHVISVNTLKHKPQSKLILDHSERDLNSEYQTGNMEIVNYNDIRKKIEHCSNELNDALKLVNAIVPAKHNKTLDSNKSTVSCQTENIIISRPKLSSKEYNVYPESSNISVFNRPYDLNTKYTDYWNQGKVTTNLYSNYMMSYSQILDTLSQEELKVNEAEQNICRLIDTFNNLNCTNVYVPHNSNVYQNKFDNIYQALTPKQMAYNRTKHLRDWLYKTNMNNKNTFN